MKVIQMEMPLEEEIKLFEKTVVRKGLSTSTDTQGDEEAAMMRRAVPPTVRKDKAEVGA